jgi:ubiquinone/menaquinone biosynthesis C-methylase UbiE
MKISLIQKSLYGTYAILLLFSTHCLSVHGKSAIEKEDIPKPRFPELYETRKVLLQEDLVIKRLRIRDGMNIIDIGAGNGAFTFRLADALHGTGHVYATDVDPDKIVKLNERSAQEGRTNISAVLVKQADIDEFYFGHTFDLIFVCDMLSVIWDVEGFFRALRPSLSKDGYLYVLDYRQPQEFHKEEIPRFERIFEFLSEIETDTPVMNRLDEETRSYAIHYKIGDTIPEKIKYGLIESFNKILQDRTLLNDVVAYYCLDNNIAVHQKKPESLPTLWSSKLLSQLPCQFRTYFINIYRRLDEAGVFAKDPKILTIEESADLKELNRMLLLVFSNMDIGKHLNYSGLVVHRTEASIKTKLEAAGFTLVNEYNIFPYYYFLEYQKKD